MPGRASPISLSRPRWGILARGASLPWSLATTPRRSRCGRRAATVACGSGATASLYMLARRRAQRTSCSQRVIVMDTNAFEPAGMPSTQGSEDEPKTASSTGSAREQARVATSSVLDLRLGGGRASGPPPCLGANDGPHRGSGHHRVRAGRHPGPFEEDYGYVGGTRGGPPPGSPSCSTTRSSSPTAGYRLRAARRRAMRCVTGMQTRSPRPDG